MKSKSIKKAFDSYYADMANQMSELEKKLNSIVELENKHARVVGILSDMEDVESSFEDGSCFIRVGLGKKIKAGKINCETFYFFVNDKLPEITTDVVGDVFETPNSIGVFAKIDNEDVTITVNKLNSVDSLYIDISGRNENGLTASDTIKKKKSRPR